MLMMRKDEMDPTEITPHLCLVHVVCKIIFFFTQMCLPMHIREQHGRFKSTVGYRDNLSIYPQFFFFKKTQQIPNCRKSISKRRKLTEASVHISH